MKNIITNVEIDSIAYEMEIEEGDMLLEINGIKITDIFDYRFLILDEYIEVLIKKQNGEEWLLEIDKDETEDLGISFSEPMMDKAQSCGNKCIFCFIDQLPEGMRETLYFKDDDSRLSFLQGNYVTLTNVSQTELARIIFYHLSPINVSVHTTNPDLRIKMLNNKNAGKIMPQLKQIGEAGIEINCQIVLVKGVNDGEELRRTISDLAQIQGVRSVSVVPVGITKYRKGLYEIESFEKNDATEVIKLIKSAQEELSEKKQANFVYASDEFYIKAETALPLYESYDDFPQLENGVGMIALFEREFYNYFNTLEGDLKERKITVITGKSPYIFIIGLTKKIIEKFTKTQIEVIMVENKFFGDKITVSGLLTGKDVLSALKEQNIAGTVLLPENCFKSGEELFLDGMSLSQLCESIGITAISVENSGEAFLKAILDT